MNEVTVCATSRLAEVAADLEGRGVVQACRELFATVWAANVARYEPDELGDTAMSLGVQTHQNFICRAERRQLHDEREAPEAHWHIDGLVLQRSGNAFTMSIGGVRISVMKVPPEHGRALNVSDFAKWDGQSKLRLEMATRNSDALGGFISIPDGDVPLFELGSPQSGQVRDFLLLLAGQTHSTATAGWLGVPVLGDAPLIAVKELWWDDTAVAAIDPVEVAKQTQPPTKFDEAAVEPLTLTLKPNANREAQ